MGDYKNYEYTGGSNTVSFGEGLFIGIGGTLIMFLVVAMFGDTAYRNGYSDALNNSLAKGQTTTNVALEHLDTLRTDSESYHRLRSRLNEHGVTFR